MTVTLNQLGCNTNGETTDPAQQITNFLAEFFRAILAAWAL